MAKHRKSAKLRTWIGAKAPDGQRHEFPPGTAWSEMPEWAQEQTTDSPAWDDAPIRDQRTDIVASRLRANGAPTDMIDAVLAGLTSDALIAEALVLTSSNEDVRQAIRRHLGQPTEADERAAERQALVEDTLRRSSTTYEAPDGGGSDAPASTSEEPTGADPGGSGDPGGAGPGNDGGGDGPDPDEGQGQAGPDPDGNPDGGDGGSGDESTGDGGQGAPVTPPDPADEGGQGAEPAEAVTT